MGGMGRGWTACLNFLFMNDGAGSKAKAVDEKARKRTRKCIVKKIQKSEAVRRAFFSKILQFNRFWREYKPYYRQVNCAGIVFSLKANIAQPRVLLKLCTAQAATF